MSIKKYSSGQWVDTPYRKYGTETDTITTLPAQIIGDGTAISAYTIKGNMQQSGTPTPSNPIYPSECGDKTANLFDFDSWADSIVSVNGNGIWSINDKTITITSVNQADAYTAPYDNTPTYGETYKIFVKPNTQYTAKAYIYTSGCRILFFENGNVSTSDIHELSVDGSISFTTKSTTTYLTFRCGISAYQPLGTTLTMGNIMLNEGSTALPYEPYGYKLPITLSSNTYPVYLSEPIRKIKYYVDSVPSTGTVSRVIKKLVLTGNESGWIMGTSNVGKRFGYRVLDAVESNTSKVNSILSHLPLTVSGGTNDYPNTYAIGSDLTLLIVLDSTYTSLEQFLDWVRGQYNNGTPVTLWYRTSAPTTESFTAPTLPTSGTAQSFDVDTMLKPPDVSLTYHGWHEHHDTVFTE